MPCGPPARRDLRWGGGEEPIQEEEETREEEKGLVICDIPGLVDKALGC